MGFKPFRSFYWLTAALTICAFVAGAVLVSKFSARGAPAAATLDGVMVEGYRGPSAISPVGQTDDLVDHPPEYVPASSHDAGLHVVVNGTDLSDEQIAYLRQYGPVRSGRFWYDARSGLWGVEGHEPAGYVQPGLSFGNVSPHASNGATSVFVNGREINAVELRWYELIFRTPSTGPGRFWLDGVTGNVGYEGNPMPIGNLIRALQQSQGTAGGSRAFAGGSMVGVTNGDCSMVTTDSGYTAASSGC